ncbi:MAG: MBL fold metallo-hydrolase [Myxococcales bacterium]|nr:MBL fold metallo-hydrolase [Myxococcales bacterium]HQY64282.1 MBL fold metallo-hydrolase [Polyangiaceae bacterium]
MGAPTGIRHFHRLVVSNVFLLDGGVGDRWLVDTGHWAERATLLWELRRAGLGPRDVTGVLLTHRHSDHAGNAAFLQRYGVKIYAHHADARVLAGEAQRPPMRPGEGTDLVSRAFAHVENLLPAARLQVDGALEDGDTVAGLCVHAVPGHTEGSVFFRHEPTRTLLTGDMLLAARPPLTLVQGLTPPFAAFTSDLALAHASLRAFHAAGFDYDNLLSGHGRPILGEAREAVARLIAGLPAPVDRRPAP